MKTLIVILILTAYTATLYSTYLLGQAAGRDEIFSGFSFDMQVLKNGCMEELERYKKISLGG